MYKKKIEGFIDSHRGEMIKDICTLCRINSEKVPYVEGKPYRESSLQVLQAALNVAEGYGFAIRNYDNYVRTAGLNDRERQLDTLAHLDMAPVGEGWTKTGPFEPVIKDGKLFGHGTADDRGPAVAALCTMRAVEKPGIPLNKSARPVLGTNGEYGSSNIVSYYDKENEAPMTSSPDVEFPVTSTEKSRLEGHFRASPQASKVMPRLAKVEAEIKANVVLSKAKAVVEGVSLKTLEVTAEAVEKETGIPFVLEGDLLVMTVTVQREGAHASTPQEGEDALMDLLVHLTRLPLAECPQMNMVKNPLKLFPRDDTCGKAAGISMEDQLFDNLTLAFSMPTVEADDLEDVFDSRCPIYATEKSVLGVIKQTMADHRLTLKDDFIIPPHHVDGNSHFVETLLSVYEDYTGLEGSCQITGGDTYVHSLRNGVAYSAVPPETDNRMHGADEFTVMDELVLSAKIFAQVIVKLCG